MAKKLKAAELFLSLGLVASLATACGGGTAEPGDAVESDQPAGMEAPAGGTSETPAPAAETPGAEEGGEGGEGGEG